MSNPRSRENLFDQLRANQRQRWLAGERPVVEAYLAEHLHLAADQNALLDFIYAEFCLREELGERPNPDEYLSRFPYHAEALRPLFRLDGSLQVRGDDGPRLQTPSRTDETVAAKRFGRFELLGLLGKGAFSAVYRAYDTILGREVALKMPQVRALESIEARARFLREPRAAAQLHHPHIVPIFDAGYERNQFYIASALIEGQTLEQALRSRWCPLRDAAIITQKLADALHYAHEQGIIHRDVKPANIMIDSRSEPHLLDFGLAHFDDGQEKLTSDGKLMGTPAYMSPEQAGAPVGEIGPSSDQYSLCVVLYELLCHALPFEGDLLRVLQQTRERQPPAPRNRNPSIPRDLETICLKGLSKRPADRYVNCRELAEDLGRWLADEPVRARPIGLAERIFRWCQRNPALAGLSAAAAALLLAVAMISMWANVKTSQALAEADTVRYRAEQSLAAEAVQRHRADEQRRRADDQRQLAERALAGEASQRRRAEQLLDNEASARKRAEAERLRAEEQTKLANSERLRADAQRNRAEALEKRPVAEKRRAEQNSYYAQIQLAQRDWLSDEFEEADRLLDACPVELRGWEWAYLKRACHPELSTLRGNPGAVLCLALSPDGKRIASSAGNMAQVWDVSSGKLVFALAGHKAVVRSVAFSPAATEIASGSDDGTVKIWDAVTGKELLVVRGHTGAVNSVAFSPDGKRFASASSDATVRVCNVASGQEVPGRRVHAGGAFSVVFSPDGKWIASGGKGGRVKIWDAAGGQEWLAFRAHTLTRDATQTRAGVSSVAFSPDGKRIVTCAGDDKLVKIWDAAKGKEIANLHGHTDDVTAVAFSPDGKRIASASADRMVKVWDAIAHKEIATLRGHTGPVSSVVFSSDGKRIVSGGLDQTMKIWDASAGQHGLALQGHTGGVWCAVYSPDGKRIASGSGDTTVKIWDATTDQQMLTLRGHSGVVQSVAFSPSGKQIASGGANEVKVWDATTGLEMLNLRGHTDAVHDVVFSPDGSRIASASVDKTVRLWDAIKGTETVTLRGHTDDVESVAFSSDGKTIATTDASDVNLWNVATGRKVLTLAGHTGHVRSATFSADGKRILSGAEDHTVKIWDAATGRELVTLRGHTGTVYSARFSPDGKRIASGAQDQTIKVWDAATGQETLTLRGHTSEVLSVAFSPDGNQIASGAQDRTVRIWDGVSTVEPDDPRRRLPILP